MAINKSQDVFVSNFYTAETAYMRIVVNYWTKFWSKTTDRIKPHFMPMFVVDNYDSASRKESETKQSMQSKVECFSIFSVFVDFLCFPSFF